MASPGDVISNPHRGERGIFRVTSAESEGKLVRIEAFIEPQGLGPVDHLHPGLEERFEILSGALLFRMDGQSRHVAKGEVVTVPPRTRHGFSNAGDEQAHLMVEFRPAGRAEELFEVGSELIQRVRVGRSGFPVNPFRLAVLGWEFREELAMAGIPLAFQRALAATFAPIGRILGYGVRSR